MKYEWEDQYLVYSKNVHWILFFVVVFVVVDKIKIAFQQTFTCTVTGIFISHYMSIIRNKKSKLNISKRRREVE